MQKKNVFRRKFLNEFKNYPPLLKLAIFNYFLSDMADGFGGDV